MGWDKMKCIATWSFTPWLNSVGSGPWVQTEDMIACAVASIEAVHDIYSKPVIYTDTLGKEILSNLTNKADFINVYDDVYKNLTTSLWAYPKILTYADQTDTYFHFDLDFICKRHFGSKFDCDVLFQVYENIGRMYDENKQIEEIYNLNVVGHLYKLPDIFHQPDANRLPVANLGCLYMNNKDFNKVYTDTVLKLINDNLEVFNTRPALNICVVEQQTFSLLLHQRPDLKSNTIMSNAWGEYPFNDDFIHFLGPWKKKDWTGVVELQNNHYGSYITDKVKYYTKMLEELRVNKIHS